MFPCPHPCLTSVPMSVTLNYTIQHLYARYLMVLSLFGKVIHQIIEKYVSMTFPPPVSIIKRVKYLHRHGYMDTDRCSLIYMQVHGVIPFMDTGMWTRVHGYAQVQPGPYWTKVRNHRNNVNNVIAYCILRLKLDPLLYNQYQHKCNISSKEVMVVTRICLNTICLSVINV